MELIWYKPNLFHSSTEYLLSESTKGIRKLLEHGGAKLGCSQGTHLLLQDSFCSYMLVFIE